MKFNSIRNDEKSQGIEGGHRVSLIEEQTPDMFHFLRGMKYVYLFKENNKYSIFRLQMSLTKTRKLPKVMPYLNPNYPIINIQFLLEF